MSGGGTMDVRRALLIQAVSKYANVAVQLGLSMVLARLLTPQDYGLVAVVTVFIALFQVMADVGIGPAVIQFRDLDKKDYSGLFTFSAILGVGLAVLFCCLSWPISLFFGDSSLVGLCLAASVIPFLSSLNMVPNGILLKRKQFAFIGSRLVVSTVVSGLAAVVLAYLGIGPYALVANAVLSVLIVFVWNWKVSGIEVGNRHFVAPLKKVASYSAYQAGFGIVNYFSRNLDNILIGKCMGVEALGLYDKAYRLTTYPNTYLAGVVSSVLQPYFAEHQNDLEYMYERWIKAAKALSLVGAALSVIFVCCAEEIILIMYGETWISSAPLFQALGVSVYFQVVNNPNGVMFQSANHTDYQFRHALVSTGITIALLACALITGDIFLVACGISLAYCLHSVSIIYFLVHKTFKKSAVRYLRVFVPECVLSVLIVFAVMSLGQFLPNDVLVSLFAKLAVICLLYIAGYYVLGQFDHLKILARKG